MTDKTIKDDFRTSSLLSKWTWTWVNPLIERGNASTLQFSDLFDVPLSNRAMYLLTSLSKQEQLNPSQTILKTVLDTFGAGYLRLSLLEIILFILQLSQIFILRAIVQFLSDEGDLTLSTAIVLSLVLGIAGILQGACHHMYFFSCRTMGLQIRSFLSAKMYQKLLELKSHSLSETSSGRIVNLISTDMFKVEFCLPFLHFSWLAPLEVVVVLVLLWIQIGVSALPGVLTLLLFVPLQSFFAKKFTKVRKNTVVFTDERIKLVKEILIGSQIMKMYNWEPKLYETIQALRLKEMQSLTKSALMKSTNLSLFFVSVSVATFITFTTFFFMGNRLDPADVFASIALLAVVQYPIANFFPLSVEGASESLIAFQRIQTFLQLGNINPQNQLIDTKSPYVISLSNASFSWNAQSTVNKPVLSDITLNICKGEFVVITGPIGSSKTSLLMAILGELDHISGTFQRPSVVSYAPQKPWIFAGSVRDNITFNRPFDQERYLKVVHSCQLEHDINQLPSNDRTMIGERGINLSGGQKARISLARALYGNAEVYLFDDPLSAVDPLVAERISNTLINGFKGETRILVTHRTEILEHADRVVVMNRGKIVFCASPSELKSSEFQSILPSFAGSRRNSIAQTSAVDDGEDAKALIEEEDRVEGKMSMQVIKALYNSMGGLAIVLPLLVVIILAQAILLFSDFWLIQWAEQDDQTDPIYYFLYASSIALAIALSFIRSTASFIVLLRSASNFHNAMFKSVLSAPMRFFESNPVGRILNRFSKDQSAVDELLPFTLFDLFQSGAMVLGALLASLIVNFWTCVCLIVIVPAFIYLQQSYVNCSREVKRLDAISKSPIYALFSSSIDGLPTLRAFDQTHNFLIRFSQFVDENNNAWYSFLALERWLGFRLDLIGAILIVTLSVTAVSLQSIAELDPAAISFALLYAIRLTSLFQWAVRQSAEVENHLTSLERIYAYENIESEESSGEDPPKDWPSNGMVRVKQFKAKYRRDLDFVLKGVDLSIKGGEKIGVCGRTGAGKSSFFLSFFRLIECTEGVIEIDGIDIGKIQLHKLRRALSIIPQEPTLFSGTLRFNLDPFHEHSDERILDALKAVRLDSLLERLGNGLDAPIAEYGGNLSTGEGQLICVARAILKPSKILFVDEATANVDKQTDELIQNLIRERFKERTVITIAHRLNTIIDYDKIVVLDHGTVAEFGSPDELAHREGGIFRDMAVTSGLVE